MHPKTPLISRTAATLLLLAFLTAHGFGSNREDLQLPSAAELEQLTFMPVAAAPDDSLHSEVSDVRALLSAYRAGLDALSNYHDPILTRGAPGISVFKTVSPAVVVVVVGRMKGQDFDPEGIGTGAIIDPHGYVLTNWHVINGYRGALVFLKPTGKADLESAPALGAKVVYQDSNVDLALLKLVNPPSSLPVLGIGDIAQVQVAEDIHIIGHPHGNLWSYSTGVVSQIREGYEWKYEDGSKHVAKVLQLQTAINPGNSGGPVVDDSGKILGLVAMSESGQNLDYAIAADVIKGFLFLGMQTTTRGAVAPRLSSIQPDQRFEATLKDKRAVSKLVYSDATIYHIKSAGGTSVALIATFRDGTVVTAWDARPSGGFGLWSETLAGGKELIANESDGAIAAISMK